MSEFYHNITDAGGTWGDSKEWAHMTEPHFLWTLVEPKPLNARPDYEEYLRLNLHPRHGFRHLHL